MHLSDKNSMFILVRMHGYNSMQVTGNLTLSKNKKERTFIGSHEAKVQIHSGFWPGLTQGLKQCHPSWGLCSLPCVSHTLRSALLL